MSARPSALAFISSSYRIVRIQSFDGDTLHAIQFVLS